MLTGLFAGILWALDTVILGIALSAAPFVADLSDNSGIQAAQQVALLAPFVSTFLHDACSSVWMLIYTGIKKQYCQVLRAMRTRSGRFIILGALLGGPVGMSGYVAAINLIGPAYTAIISAMYPALGAFLSWLFLKEKMKPLQITGLIACIAGVIVMGYTPSEGAPGSFALGFGCALLCCVGWASEAVICAYGMKDPEVRDEHALQIRQLTSALFYGAVILPVLQGWEFTAGAIATGGFRIICVSALAGTASYLCYYKAIAKIGPSRAMALNITYSAWSILFALLLLHTLPDAKSVLCGIVIVAGALVAAKGNGE